jgi:tRNA(Ile)-lysidine synthetase-like protein
MQKMLSKVRKACNDYKMIENGDKIAIGVSGGKDSVALLKALAMYSMFSTEKFTIEAISVDLFNGKTDYTELERFCSELNVNLTIINSSINKVLFEDRKEKNPCSLCSKMRRGALNAKALELGCNKVALGHHSDDLIETFFLSMFYEGRLSTFHPISYMDRTGITIIRPLLYVNEREIIGAVKRHNMPIIHNPCLADKHTKREYIKQLLKDIQKDVPIVKDRIFGAVTHPERYNLFDRIWSNFEENKKNKKE